MLDAKKGAPYILAMTKDRFRSLIRQAGIRQRQVALDLGIAPSTIVRWPEDQIPRYAAAYALLMVRVTEPERAQARLEMAAAAEPELWRAPRPNAP
jgi:transcriptional regulator with XRE-family HTH domain